MLLMLIACSTPCDLRSGAAELTSRFDAAVAAPTAEAFTAQLDTIEDPTVRDAAVLRWISDHRKILNAGVTTELCGRLPAQDRTQCERRAAAAHLAR